jgi:hypothetical protein
LVLKLWTGRDLQYFAALAFAYARDDARAKALADDLDKTFSDDASEVIAGLGAAATYELGATRTTNLDWTAMFPVFVRL